MERFGGVIAALLVVAMALAGCSTTSDSMKASASGDASGVGSAGDGVSGSQGGSAMVQTSSDGRDGKGGVDAYGRANPKEYAAAPNLSDIHFDFDSYDIRAEAAKTLEASAEWLRNNPRHLVLIEGHADERGTNEYNIALGDRRARAAMNYLVSHGVQARRISRISYGEERAACSQSTEECWAKNRRAHFSVRGQ